MCDFLTWLRVEHKPHFYTHAFGLDSMLGLVSRECPPAFGLFCFSAGAPGNLAALWGAIASPVYFHFLPAC